MSESSYPTKVQKLFETIKSKSKDAVIKAAAKTVETLDRAGIVYVFGTGHSSMIAEEAFHRAGGLIPVHPILYDFLSPHESPKVSGRMERLEGVAKILFYRSGAKSGDLMWIVSQSGINSASVEMAMEAKNAGVFTIALTSLVHSKSVESRHSSKKKLFELCDLVIDNQCPAGDAIMEYDNVKVAATSTLANIFVYNWVLSETCGLLKKAGKDLPIYQSANTKGGDEHNEKFEQLFRSRISLI